MKHKIKFLKYVVPLILLTGILSPNLWHSAEAQNPQDLNCTATPDQMLGQAFRRGAGVVGEISDNGITPEGLDIEDAGLAIDADWIAENLVYSGSGPNKVGIIVIDDFSSEPDADVLSHGWLVWEVLNDLMVAMPDLTANITLDQINIGDENGYRSDLVAATLQNKLASLSSSQGINRFVLNMSFVIIPCQSQALNFNFLNFVAEHEADPSKSVVSKLSNDPAYLQAILENTSVNYITESNFEGNGGNQPAYVQEKLLIFRLFEDRKLQSDPLRTFLRQQKNYTIIPIASAGNFKWKRPFYPARWGEVLSVSAEEGENGQRWGHSNNGDVSVPGAWYLFDDGDYRAGTSLAAPVVSMMMAIDQTQNNPTCGIKGNAPEPTKGNYENEPLLDAVDQEC